MNELRRKKCICNVWNKMELVLFKFNTYLLLVQLNLLLVLFLMFIKQSLWYYVVDLIEINRYPQDLDITNY